MTQTNNQLHVFLRVLIGSPDGAHANDVMAAVLAFQNNETAAMLVYQTNHVEVQLFTYVNIFFCYNTFVWLLDTRVYSLYCLSVFIIGQNDYFRFGLLLIENPSMTLFCSVHILYANHLVESYHA